MRKIFIDGGGNDGCSVRLFRAKYDPTAEYEVYSFEPNPKFWDSYKDFPNHNLIKSSLWVSNTDGLLYVGKNRDSFGSTLIREKITGNLDYNNPIKTKTINLGQWIEQEFSKDDYIFLKLNVEGAEYEILKNMITDGTIFYVNKLAVQWHWHKIKMARAIHDGLIADLKKHKIPTENFDTWNSAPYRNKENR